MCILLTQLSCFERLFPSQINNVRGSQLLSPQRNAFHSVNTQRELILNQNTFHRVLSNGRPRRRTAFRYAVQQQSVRHQDSEERDLAIHSSQYYLSETKKHI